MSQPRRAIIEAPSVLGLFPGGVERLPEALLDAGLAERLGARQAGRVESPPYDPSRDAATGLLNPGGIAGYTLALGDAVGRVLEAGEFPLVLGGDCSILLGCLLATRRRGRHGLLFLDGHADFYDPASEPKGEAASMDLALAVGRGPAVVTDPDGLRPLVREEDVIVLGRRDGEDTERYRSPRVEDTGVEMMDLAALRRVGVGEAADRAVRRLTSPELRGFWIHLDLDVLDDALVPAVDYRLPGGLSWEDLAAILRAALASGRAVGLDVTILNPVLDVGGGIARRLVGALGDALGEDSA